MPFVEENGRTVFKDRRVCPWCGIVLDIYYDPMTQGPESEVALDCKACGKTVMQWRRMGGADAV